MRPNPLWRATSFRLTLLQTLLFVLAFAAAGLIANAMLRRAEHQAIDAEIAAQAKDLQDLYASGGLPALEQIIAARQRDPSIWEFRIEGRDGRRLAGDLPFAGPPGRWTKRLVEGDLPDGQSETVRAERLDLAGGLHLTVGEDLGQRERADNALLFVVLAVAAAAVALSLVVGAALAWRALAKIEAMTAVMRRYGAGELEARVDVKAAAFSDLDLLAQALNGMLDRTTRLMAGLRQVSADIAHDLRRPLVRHNERIARTLQGPANAEAYRLALVEASDDVNAALQTFQALLHIAELEAGAPGLDVEPVDLTEVAARVVDAFLPMAEEGGRRLTLSTCAEEKAPVMATSGLLTQMMANLVENALVHTPPGARVTVAVEAGRRLTVRDDGPGVPEADLGRIFQRFTRLDASRTTPGTGLGLALSAAIAHAFEARIWAERASPGLRIVVQFPKSRAP
jgi:signal transduction histidine kinase